MSKISNVLIMLQYLSSGRKYSINELAEKIGQYDALMVRSQTKVTAKIIEAGKNLKIIGSVV